MKKFGSMLLVVLMVLSFVNLSLAADYELTTHPVSSLNTFPDTNPVSGDFIPVLDGSASEVKKLDATEMFFNTNFFASGHSGGATSIASQVTPLTSAHLAFGLMRILNGSPGRHPLPDGVRGKVITIQLIADPNYTIIDDTPGDMTKTGWESILFDNARDSVTVAWIDDTVGWIITSNEGCTIGY